MIKMNCTSREQFLRQFKITYLIELEDNCHKNIFKQIEYMKTFKEFKDLDLICVQFLSDKPDTINIIESRKESLKWRKFEDNEYLLYETVNFRGHSCPGVYKDNTLYIFDIVLLPWKYAIRGLEIEQYLFLTTKPQKKMQIKVDIFENPIMRYKKKNDSILINLKTHLPTVDTGKRLNLNNYRTIKYYH